ncbi:MAG: ribulokinase [Ruminococcaceae bacterium]|nr:ribulokinase [Oscillospiraceae bacterium]
MPRIMFFIDKKQGLCYYQFMNDKEIVYMKKRYTVGMDFGTLSVRSVLMDADSGEEIAYEEYSYPHGVMDHCLSDGTPVKADAAYQDPADYLLGFDTVKRVISSSGVKPDEIVSICIDFTTCTILPVDEGFKPLCFDPAFSSVPHSYVKLWKHHGAQSYAESITSIAEERKEPWLDIYGGKVSAEWALPKIVETFFESREVYDATYRFTEAADWLSYVLTGEESHAVCFAGFKALWNENTGYPSREFLRCVHPELGELCATKLSDKVLGAGKIAGRLNQRGAELTGLLPGTVLGLPMIDAQASMPGLGAVGDGEMLIVVGTSNCHLINSKKTVAVPGIAGYVNEALMPGMCTYEAGQSGAGDCFDWFVKNCVGDRYWNEARERGISIHKLLREKAEGLIPGESGLVFLDWLNGNRSVLCDYSLSGLFAGLTLSTAPEEMYRALIEAVAFGTKIIIDRYREYGVDIEGLFAAGGIPAKDPMLMQIFADVIALPITVPDCPASGARGSAVAACVAAGIYPDLSVAAHKLSPKKKKVYEPIERNVAIYKRLFEKYLELHDHFGLCSDLMKELRVIASDAKKLQDK